MTATEAVAERDRVLSEVEVAKRRAIDAGLVVLRRWADRGQPFSANDCREELRSSGVTGPATGALFNAAIKARLIRRIGYVRSTDIGTHGKPVMQYVAADAIAGLSSLIPPREVLAVPVRRDRGRFTTSSTPAPDALFDITEEGTA